MRWAVWALGFCACTASVEPAGPYACDDGACPAGYACVDERCVAEDTGPPGGGGGGGRPDAGVGGGADLECAGVLGPDGQCFESFADGVDHRDAGNACEDRGGHLATVTSSRERMAFEQALDLGTGWIGLEQERDGELEWVTGEPFDFAAWLPGEPAQLLGDGCVLATIAGWRVIPCDERSPYVCERR